MRTTATVLMVLAFSTSFASADDFTLRNAAGESFGPFAFQEGASIRLEDATYRIASVTNTVEHPCTGRVPFLVRRNHATAE